MNKSVSTPTQPQMALQSYLDDLLQEATLELDEDPEPVEPEMMRAEPALAGDPQPLQAAAAPVPDKDVEDAFARAVAEERRRDEGLPAPCAEPESFRLPVLLDTAPEVPEPEPAPVPSLEPAEVMPPAATPPAFERGAWEDEPFECLLFDVAGLKLAVPLVTLGSIHSLAGQELTPLFGQPEWFMGLLPCAGGNLRVLDTARWLIPDRYQPEFRDNLQYVISIQGYEWGLAVHGVSHSIRLDPRQVKWRTRRTQRPWLAGTVIEQMCALLDVTALAALIARGDTQHFSSSGTPVASRQAGR